MKMPFSFLSSLLQLSALCTAGLRLLQTHQDEHCAASHALLILLCAQLLCQGVGEVTCEEYVWEHVPWSSFYPAME